MKPAGLVQYCMNSSRADSRVSCLVQCSEIPATEPDESTSRPSNQCPLDFLQYYPPTYPQVFHVVSFLHFKIPTKTLYAFPYLSCVPLSQSTTYSLI
jgi:hypothetical protein